MILFLSGRGRTRGMGLFSRQGPVACLRAINESCENGANACIISNKHSAIEAPLDEWWLVLMFSYAGTTQTIERALKNVYWTKKPRWGGEWFVGHTQTHQNRRYGGSRLCIRLPKEPMYSTCKSRMVHSDVLVGPPRGQSLVSLRKTVSSGRL